MPATSPSRSGVNNTFDNSAPLLHRFLYKKCIYDLLCFTMIYMYSHSIADVYMQAYSRKIAIGQHVCGQHGKHVIIPAPSIMLHNIILSTGLPTHSVLGMHSNNGIIVSPGDIKVGLFCSCSLDWYYTVGELLEAALMYC